MSVKITWLGHASFIIRGSNQTIFIDPWEIPSKMESEQADIVFVSHDHYDHFSKADIEQIRKDDTFILAPPVVAKKFKNGRSIRPGEKFNIDHMTFHIMPAYNIAKDFHPKKSGGCGVVVSIDGKNIYYAGDTDRILEMQSLSDIDVALLPVGGTYTMDSTAAAQAAGDFAPKLAIPCHWGKIVGKLKDAQDFVNKAICDARILKPGESIEICDKPVLNII